MNFDFSKLSPFRSYTYTVPLVSSSVIMAAFYHAKRYCGLYSGGTWLFSGQSSNPSNYALTMIGGSPFTGFFYWKRAFIRIAGALKSPSLYTSMKFGSFELWMWGTSLRQRLSSGVKMMFFKLSFGDFFHSNWVSVLPVLAHQMLRLLLVALFGLNFSHVMMYESAGEYIKDSTPGLAINRVSWPRDMSTKWMPSSSTIAACCPRRGANRATFARGNYGSLLSSSSKDG